MALQWTARFGAPSCFPEAATLDKPNPIRNVSDTARWVAIYRAMEPADRLRQALRMNRSMRELMAAGFRQRHPEWTESQVSRAVATQILHVRTG